MHKIFKRRVRINYTIAYLVPRHGEECYCYHRDSADRMADSVRRISKIGVPLGIYPNSEVLILGECAAVFTLLQLRSGSPPWVISVTVPASVQQFP